MIKRITILFVVALLLVPGASLSPVAANGPDGRFFRVRTTGLDDGTILSETVISGPPDPPPGYIRTTSKLPVPSLATGVNVLSDVPAFNWSFGCSATSAAMIAGYYDRTGYGNMYAGPTNGGVMPLDNSVWPDWHDGTTLRHQCPLSATHLDLDGRSTKGHVDDYWVVYGHAGPDPFIGNWPEHTYGQCTGDYMKTNQSTYGNVDGATSFWNYTNGDPLPCSSMPGYEIGNDGGYGLMEFYQSRGYTVTDCYNQYRLGYESPTLGFTYGQYKAEIDAGRPVMIHAEGHTMVGIGYDDATNLMYIHDTWDYNVHTMTWGGSYSGMEHMGVTIVQLAPITTPPAAPSNLVATTAGPDEIELTWIDNSTDETGFGIERSPDGSTWTLIDTVGANITIYPDTGLAPGTTYYRVYAYNAFGNSDYSNEASATTADDPPTVTITDPADGATVSGNIDIVTDASDDDDVVQVEFFVDGGSIGTDSDGGDGWSVVWDTTSVSDGDHTVSATATDTATQTNGDSIGVTVANADATPPAPPANLVATGGDGYVDLAWSANGESDLAGYTVYRAASGGGPYSSLTASLLTDPSYTDSDVSPGTTYYYVVTASDTSGNESGDSNEASATTSDDPPEPAASPDPTDGATGVTPSPTLSWTAGAGSESHDVYFGTSADPLTFQANQTETTFVPSGPLALSTTYYWRIDEVNGLETTTGAVWSFTTRSSVGHQTLYLPSIVLNTVRTAKGTARGRATLVVDDLGDFVDAATVTGTFSDPYGDTLSHSTDASGTAVVTTAGANKKLAFELCMKGITHVELTYVEGDIAMTCATYP